MPDTNVTGSIVVMASCSCGTFDDVATFAAVVVTSTATISAIGIDSTDVVIDVDSTNASVCMYGVDLSATLVVVDAVVVVDGVGVIVGLCFKWSTVFGCVVVCKDFVVANCFFIHNGMVLVLVRVIFVRFESGLSMM